MAQSEYEINTRKKESDEMIKRVNKLVLGISLILVISITAGCGMGKEAEDRKF